MKVLARAPVPRIVIEEVTLTALISLVSAGDDVQRQAAAAGQKLSMLEVHAAVLEACVRAGEAELDNSAVIREVRRRGKN